MGRKATTSQGLSLFSQLGLESQLEDPGPFTLLSRADFSH